MSLILLVFGILMFSKALKTRSQSKKDLPVFLRTRGEVVAIDTIWRRYIKRYSPQVAFKTNQNQVFYFTRRFHSRTNYYRVGQPGEVYYNPQNPNMAGIVGDRVGQLNRVICLVLGVLATFGGVIGGVVELLIYTGRISFK